MTSYLMHHVAVLDKALIKLYPAYDIPVDKLISDSQRLETFIAAVNSYLGSWMSELSPEEFADVVRNRLLYLRRISSKRRKANQAHLPLLGRRWKGPNIDALIEAVIDENNKEIDLCQ